MFDMSGCKLNDSSCKLNHGIYEILDTNLVMEKNALYGGWKRRGLATHFELLLDNSDFLFKTTTEKTIWVRASGPHSYRIKDVSHYYGNIGAVQDDLDKFYVKNNNISSLVGNYFSLAFFIWTFQMNLIMLMVGNGFSGQYFQLMR